MDNLDKIRSIFKKKKTLTTAEVVKSLAISRQMAHRYLTQLVHSNEIYKQGGTRSSSYHHGPRSKQKSLTSIKLLKETKNLLEDKVFEEVAMKLQLKKILNKAAFKIAYYSFSEMLNNAIDHSNSKKVNAIVEIKNGTFSFTIKDSGIGIYNRLKKGFKLSDDYESIEHLFKGKQTTFPERHSGQGIFFTSRIADQFAIKSNELQIIVDNFNKDQIIKTSKKIIGTEVSFKIKMKTKKNLQELFNDHSSDEFEFDTNNVRVKLSATKELVSRSQARKLLNGLEKFTHIIFDFKNVNGIGQAYADEIFRVFANMNPSKRISYINADRNVTFMIERIQK